MSDLKYRTVPELLKLRDNTKRDIGILIGKINNLEERLKWINHYIEQKTPVDISIEELEIKLGYKINIVKS